MPTYFKPLRRKIGVVTLGTALIILVAYLCSYDGENAPFAANLGLDFTNGDFYFDFYVKSMMESIEWECKFFRKFPSWPVVLLLTLLSAWLLLSKPPPKKPPEKQAERI